ERVDLPQGSEILRIAQNRLTEKKSLAQLKIPIPPYQKITSEYELLHAMEKFGELKLKTVTGGYDGKGQVRVSDTEQIPDAFNTLSQAKQTSPQQVHLQVPILLQFVLLIIVPVRVLWNLT
ncbi:MAG: ATP-grasp domain-containing protein, partial [SAR324 cluster bacterium]|nr:ATP-grasp domain-containing protein [SAR324 cluster bacterium]